VDIIVSFTCGTGLGISDSADISTVQLDNDYNYFSEICLKRSLFQEFDTNFPRNLEIPH